MFMIQVLDLSISDKLMRLIDFKERGEVCLTYGFIVFVLHRIGIASHLFSTDDKSSSKSGQSLSVKFSVCQFQPN